MGSDEKLEPTKTKRQWLDHALDFIRSVEGVTFMVTIIMLIAVSILFAQSRAASKDNRAILANIQDCIDGTGPCGESNDKQLESVYRFIIASNYCAVEVTTVDLGEFTDCIFKNAPKVVIPQ